MIKRKYNEKCLLKEKMLIENVRKVPSVPIFELFRQHARISWALTAKPSAHKKGSDRSSDHLIAFLVFADVCLDG
jgi:hypothetical protein